MGRDELRFLLSQAFFYSLKLFNSETTIKRSHLAQKLNYLFYRQRNHPSYYLMPKMRSTISILKFRISSLKLTVFCLVVIDLLRRWFSLSRNRKETNKKKTSSK